MLSFDAQLDACNGWDEYTASFQRANGSEGRLVAAARKLTKLLSFGEISVLMAMLHAADYSHVADEIGGKGLWTRFARTREDFTDAIVFAIKRS
jgi:hypothetical protein